MAAATAKSGTRVKKATTKKKKIPYCNPLDAETGIQVPPFSVSPMVGGGKENLVAMELMDCCIVSPVTCGGDGDKAFEYPGGGGGGGLPTNTRIHLPSRTCEDGLNAKQLSSPRRLSDVQLASRKAEAAALRRSQATAWLQSMVGPLDLCTDPSEEDFRLCLRNGIVLCNLINKVQPGSVPKIVDNPTPASPPDGPALSAYQHFENVRNFLVAVEEMKLPSFEACDLEKGNVTTMTTGSLVNVVNCILALRSFHERRQHGRRGSWKFGALIKSPRSNSRPVLGISSSNGNNLTVEEASTRSTLKPNQRRQCRFSIEGPKNLSEEFTTLLPSAQGTENAWPSLAWIHTIACQFPDALPSSMKEMNDVTGATCKVENKDDDQPLLNLLQTLFAGKQLEEIPYVVEYMLQKVIEEYERKFSNPENLSKTIIQKSPGQEITSAQSGEKKTDENENKVSPGELKKMQLEYMQKVQNLELELEKSKSEGQEHKHHLEAQKTEIEVLKRTYQVAKEEFTSIQNQWKEELNNINAHVRSLGMAAAGYHKVVAENRDLFNQVQDLKGNLRVYCRVRPFLPGQSSNQNTVGHVGEDGSIIILNPTRQGKDSRKAFKFNKVFDPTISQVDVYSDIQPLIRSVLDGYNVCILAYGQTGSGKTYTMTGPDNASANDYGVNFRALSDLFELSENRKELLQYEVGVQMLEIYNEQVRDLLSDGANRRLEIRNNSQQNGLNVPDANVVSVRTSMDVLNVMETGYKNRAIGATAMNERSSRSHSVLSIHVEGKELASGTILHGCLHLVDLAGSERVDRSDVVGERLKEAQHINRSLSALGDVISALAQKNAHIPYRNSKLTQLLQDALGGQAKTLMFVHISPDESSFNETLSTLKFAERAATVELGAARSNKEMGEIRELKEQVRSLRETLSKKEAELGRVVKEKCINNDLLIDSNDNKARLFKSNTIEEMKSRRRQPLEEMRISETRRRSILGISPIQKSRLHRPPLEEEEEEEATGGAAMTPAKRPSFKEEGSSGSGGNEDEESTIPNNSHSPPAKRLFSCEGASLSSPPSSSSSMAMRVADKSKRDGSSLACSSLSSPTAKRMYYHQSLNGGVASLLPETGQRRNDEDDKSSMVKKAFLNMANVRRSAIDKRVPPSEAQLAPLPIRVNVDTKTTARSRRYSVIGLPGTKPPIRLISTSTEVTKPTTNTPPFEGNVEGTSIPRPPHHKRWH